MYGLDQRVQGREELHLKNHNNTTTKSSSRKYDLVAQMIGGPDAHPDYQRTMHTTDGFQTSFVKKGNALSSYDNTWDDDEILVVNASGANGKS